MEESLIEMDGRTSWYRTCTIRDDLSVDWEGCVSAWNSFDLAAYLGLGDMSSYDAYFEGRLTDFAYPEEKIKEALKELPDIKENQ